MTRPVWIAVVFGTGFLARLFFVVYAPATGGDAVEYTAIATHLATSGTFALADSAPTIYRAPGYPFFMAAVYLVFGDSSRAVVIAQLVVGAATAVLLYATLARIVTEPVARITAVIAAASPALAKLASGIYYETVLAALLVSLVYCVYRSNDADTPTRAASYFAAAAGLAGAGACLVTPRFFAAPLIAAGALAVGGLPHRRGAAVASCLAASLLALTPWTVRNYRTFGVALPSGMETPALLLWLGAHRAPSDDWRFPRLYKGDALMQRYQSARGDHAHEPARIRERLALEREVLRETARTIANDPSGYVHDRAKNYPALWMDPIRYAELFRGPLAFAHRNMAIGELLRSRRYAATLVRSAAFLVFFAAPAALILVGLIVAAPRWRRHAGAWLLTGWLAITHAPVFIEHRYSLPLHPVLAIFAALALQRLLDLLQARRSLHVAE